MTPILVGTSGYGYTEWIGPVYPEGSGKDELLSRYATLFRTVELNATSYRRFRPEEPGLLMREAGPDFLFSLKAHEALSLRVDPGAWREEAGKFIAAAEAFREAGRLGALLFQFPPSFAYEPERRHYLAALLGEFAAFPCAVEFHNPAWFNNRVFDALRGYGAALVSLDLPGLKGLPPLVDVVTATFAYIRFHGRNEAAWWSSDSASRYDYLYDDEELRSWAERIRGIAGRVQRIFVYYNNYLRGQAVSNARDFAALLARGGLLP
jgi:uncharacterized protein YecE (DUF72 family)